MYTNTNWCVLTGAPSTGKSTILTALKERGYETVPETAREYLRRRQAAGDVIDAIRADQLTFQRQLVAEQASIERRLDPNMRVFLDRALPDAIGYYRAAALDPAELWPLVTSYRYHRVFVIEPLTAFSADGVRAESLERAAALARELKAGYSALNYPLFSVPPLPVDDRVTYILNHLER
jgi:predicted ATPase